jgi:SAM-dependent methyltransferase
MTEQAAALFGAVSRAYASHRPTYPPSFFSAFAARCPGQKSVWDCGCGSGQASLALAEHFEQVLASDASAEQLQQAPPHPRIHYRQAPATTSGLAPASVDGVLVAAAVHWFAGEAFNAEVCRVASDGAAMAWIGYLPLQLAATELQVCLDHFYGTTLEPWWPRERHWVDRCYAGLPFPGEEWPFPDQLWIERHWNLTDLLGYLGTWSAVERARQHGLEPLKPLSAELRQRWPDEGNQTLLVRWPFMGRWGRISR